LPRYGEKKKKKKILTKNSSEMTRWGRKKKKKGGPGLALEITQGVDRPIRLGGKKKEPRCRILECFGSRKEKARNRPPGFSIWGEESRVAIGKEKRAGTPRLPAAPAKGEKGDESPQGEGKRSRPACEGGRREKARERHAS